MQIFGTGDLRRTDFSSWPMSRCRISSADDLGYGTCCVCKAEASTYYVLGTIHATSLLTSHRWYLLDPVINEQLKIQIGQADRSAFLQSASHWVHGEASTRNELLHEAREGAIAIAKLVRSDPNKYSHFDSGRVNLDGFDTKVSDDNGNS